MLTMRMHVPNNLGKRTADRSDLEVLFPVEANAVFLKAPAEKIEALRARGWRFYTLSEAEPGSCSRGTRPDRVNSLAEDILQTL